MILVLKVFSQDLYQSPDYFQMDELLTEEHKLIRYATREWVKKNISPIIEDACQKSEFPKQIIKGLGEIGAFGSYIPVEYGGHGLDQISYGLIMQELERGDSGVRSTASVQSSLVMFPIWKFGSDEQKEKFLPKLASGEMMGCFGLTEPDHGSDPGGMTTNFKSDGDYVILNGAKLWISNSPFADIAIVWAKDEDKRIHGLIVERGMEGLTTPETHNKWSLRASSTGELIFDNVCLSRTAMIGDLDCALHIVELVVDHGIAMVCAEAVGIMSALYTATLQYVKTREQFGQPIGRFQVIKHRMVDMLMACEEARSMAYMATLKLDESDPNVRKRAASAAKVCIGKAARFVGQQSIQLHGGIGMTDELVVGHYFKRLTMIDILFGDVDFHLRRYSACASD